MAHIQGSETPGRFPRLFFPKRFLGSVLHSPPPHTLLAPAALEAGRRRQDQRLLFSKDGEMAEIPASAPEDRGSSGFPAAPNTGQIIRDRFLGLGWR